MGQIRFTLDGVDMTPPVLSAATGAAQGTSSATWSVTSDEAGGTIFAAARLSSAGVLSRAQIEAGSGAAQATSTDPSPVAGTGNGGTLNGLSPSTTYRVDLFQRDAAGNQSAVVTSPAFTTNTASGASVTIDIMEQSGLAAPQGAFFEAHVAGFDVSETLDLAQYDDSFARLRYRWTITRQGEAYSPQASDKVENLPAAHNDTNTAYGKRIGHVFTAPGTYTISCEVQDDAGTTGQGSTTLSVADPDTVFAGNDHVVGSASAARPGATVHATLASAVSGVLSGSGPARIGIERGSTHAVRDLVFSSGAPDIYIDAYGSGARPIVGEPGIHGIRLNASFGGNLQVEGLEFVGGWDSTTETGNNAGNGILTFDTANEQYLVVNDCIIRNWSEAIKSPRSSNYNVHHATYVHNCDIIGNRSYAGQIVPISPGSYYSATGNFCGSRIEDMQGGPKDGTYNNHGSWRFAAMGVCYMAANDLFVRCGWNPGVGWHPFIQPCIRWNTSNYQGTSGVFERNALEAGFFYDAGGNNSYGSNLLIEKNLHVGHSGRRNLIQLQSPGATVRNNLFVHPNTPRSTNAGKNFVSGGPQSGTTQHDPNWPVEIYSNTCVVLVDDANRNGVVFSLFPINGFPGLLEVNNIIDIPNATGQNGEAGLNLSQGRLTTVSGLHNPRWQGLKYRASASASGQQLTMDTTYQSPDDSVKEFRPGAGSAALSSASGRCAIDDFYSVLRPVAVGSRARGAVEPS